MGTVVTVPLNLGPIASWGDTGSDDLPMQRGPSGHGRGGPDPPLLHCLPLPLCCQRPPGAGRDRSSAAGGRRCQAWPLQTFSQRRTSSHQGNKRALPTPTPNPLRAQSKQLNGPGLAATLALAPPQPVLTPGGWERGPLDPGCLPAPGGPREPGRGPAFHREIRQAACCVFVFVFLHSSLNTVRLHLLPLCLVPPLRHCIQK